MTGSGVSVKLFAVCLSQTQNISGKINYGNLHAKTEAEIGRLFSRAYLDAKILPSVPRSPKPPGTRIPFNSARCFSGPSFSISSASRCTTSTSQSFLILHEPRTRLQKDRNPASPCIYQPCQFELYVLDLRGDEPPLPIHRALVRGRLIQEKRVTKRSKPSFLSMCGNS